MSLIGGACRNDKSHADSNGKYEHDTLLGHSFPALLFLAQEANLQIASQRMRIFIKTEVLGWKQSFRVPSKSTRLSTNLYRCLLF